MTCINAVQTKKIPRNGPRMVSTVFIVIIVIESIRWAPLTNQNWDMKIKTIDYKIQKTCKVERQLYGHQSASDE